MPPTAFGPSAKPLSGRYVPPTDREEIALLLIQGHGVREIARRLGRAAFANWREIRRNAATRGRNLDYRATTAQWHAERPAGLPKATGLAARDKLRRWVEDRLSGAVAEPGDPPVIEQIPLHLSGASPTSA
jgi:IS30 family transposase